MVVKQVLLGKYIVRKVLSQTCDSFVYLAEHQKLGCYRVIKQVLKTSPYFNCLYQEAQLMKILKHPCIPQVTDFEEDEISIYLVEEYMEGESLASLCQKEHLEEYKILVITKGIGQLLLFLHSQKLPIYHLDLKPENIIIRGTDIKLVDFGSAVNKTDAEKRQFSFGTPGFAAPELYGDQQPDERADIYGIGILIYYMIFGKKYQNEQISQNDFFLNYSSGLWKIVCRCLRPNPADRFAAVEELLASITAIENKAVSKKNEKQFIRYAIAGSQQHIGTTHFSLQLNTYLKKQLGSSLYVQKGEDEGKTIRSIVACYQGILPLNGVYHFERFDLCAEKTPTDFVLSNYSCIVEDYGILHENIMDSYQSADVRFVVLGGKPWEMAASQTCVALLCNDKKVNYLFNYLSVLDYQTVTKNIRLKHCFRIPYCAEGILNETQIVMRDFFCTIFSEINEETFGKKVRRWFHLRRRR